MIAGQEDLARSGQLGGDLGPGIAGADQQDGTVRQLGRVAVLNEWSWRMPGSSSPAKAGSFGFW